MTCLAAKRSYSLEILDVATIGIILSRQRITNNNNNNYFKRITFFGTNASLTYGPQI